MTNADLEKIVDTSDEWIRTRTGIRQRHIAEPGTPTSELAARAARMALEKRGIGADELDLIVIGTVTPDTPLPRHRLRRPGQDPGEEGLGLRHLRGLLRLHLRA
jgi:3-oxoacyl-[acyl-carrier-protein] synthase III